MMKTILLTFDYELFMGLSGTAQKCIIEPTERIIGILDKQTVKASFFIDTMYLKRLKEEDADTYKLVSGQIQKLIRSGHRIELHLHPQWLDAQLHEDGQWHFGKIKHFSLQDIEEEQVIGLFQEGKQILEEIAHEQEPNYKVIAFRAGGLAIMPFDKLHKAFLQTGILVDSSVAPGIKFETNQQSFNMENFSKNEPYYFDNNPLQPAKNGRFFEIPLASFSRHLIDKLAEKIATSYNGKISGDGSALVMKHTQINGTYSRMRMLLSPARFQFSLDNIHPTTLIRKMKQSNSDTICMVSHPKLMSEMSFVCLEKVLSNRHFSFDTVQGLFNKAESNKMA